MKILHELKFVDIKEGPSGDISYVLVRNPYKVIKAHYLNGHVGERFYNALIQRTSEIGADDLKEIKVDKPPLKRRKSRAKA